MIAEAACRQASPESRSFSAGRAVVILSASRGPPMTPVEATKTVLGRQGKRSAVASTVRSTACSPAAPVKALALPELATRARAAPPARVLRHQSTGAAAVPDVVKTPATAVPGASSASIRSSPPPERSPQAPAASRTPARSGMSGKLLGARGEILSMI